MTESALTDDVNSVLEIVLDGLDEASISRAMKAGITAACRPGIRAVSAGNFGGKLGPHHFRLRDIVGDAAERGGSP
jgi:formylmethanofuran--tetrahydromethanopterin N-formyltransferase